MITGFVVPLVVSVVVAAQWPLWVKVPAALGASVVAGTVATVVSGGFSSGRPWLATVGAVFAASQASYHLFWKPTGIGVLIEQRVTLLSDWLTRVFHLPTVPPEAQ